MDRELKRYLELILNMCTLRVQFCNFQVLLGLFKIKLFFDVGIECMHRAIPGGGFIFGFSISWFSE